MSLGNVATPVRPMNAGITPHIRNIEDITRRLRSMARTITNASDAIHGSNPPEGKSYGLVQGVDSPDTPSPQASNLADAIREATIAVENLESRISRLENGFS